MNTTTSTQHPSATAGRQDDLALPDDPARAPGTRRWVALIAKVLLPGGLFAMSIFGAMANPAQAQTASSKIATDLQQVIAASSTPSLSWAKDVSGLRMVKVLVVSSSSDPDLVALRSDVLAKGGSVYFRYVSVAALSAMLPANRVVDIAARSDVQSISPNRLTARTASTLEYTTGALAAGVRTYSNATTYSGLDGTNVGIAVLDSGVLEQHKNLLDGTGKLRVLGRSGLPEGRRRHCAWREGLDARPRCLGLALSAQQDDGELRVEDQLSRHQSSGRVWPWHARRLRGGGPRLLPGDGLHRHRPERQRLRRQGARRQRLRPDERRAGRHRLGDLSRQGIQHPRAEPEPGRRFDRDLSHRSAGARCARRRGRRHHRRGGRRQLRQVGERRRGLRHGQLARP